MRFNGLLRSRNPDALDKWIDDAIDTELTAIMRFASVLRRDIDAVRTDESQNVVAEPHRPLKLGLTH